MKDFNKANNGRSMLEILAVISVIGVLTLGGFVGIRMMFRKHRANEVYDELQRSMLVVWSRSDVMNIPAGQEIKVAKTGDAPYKMEVRRIDETKYEGAIAEIEVSDIDRKTCVELLKRPIDTPFMIKVGDREFNPKHPDYSVCDVFEEANLSLFVSNAYAADKPTITYRVPKQRQMSELGEAVSKTNCGNGEWWAKEGKCCEGGVADPYGNPEKTECCSANSVKILTQDGALSACCASGEKAFVNENGKAECCNGNLYKTKDGYTACCSASIVGVVGGSCGDDVKDWCCQSGNISYCENQDGSPMCCDGTVVRVNDKPYCCGKDAGEPKTVLGASDGSTFCCKDGQPYMTDNGPQCCSGTPYKTLPLKSMPKSVQCCEKGKKAVKVYSDVVGSFGTCCESEDYAYYDATTQAVRCCATEPVKKNGRWTCDSCLAGESETEVLGAKNRNICCSTEKYGVEPKAYNDGKKSACCAGEVYPIDFQVIRTWGGTIGSKGSRYEYNYKNPTYYACCSGKDMELVDVKYLFHDGLKHCCPKGQKAYLDSDADLRTTPTCCDGDIINVNGKYQCCGAGMHAVNVEGGNGGQVCCPKSSNSALPNGQCCPSGTASFSCDGEPRCLITDVDKICSGHIYETCDAKRSAGYGIVSPYGYDINGYQERNFCEDYEDWLCCLLESGICDN